MTDLKPVPAEDAETAILSLPWPEGPMPTKPRTIIVGRHIIRFAPEPTPDGQWRWSLMNQILAGGLTKKSGNDEV